MFFQRSCAITQSLERGGVTEQFMLINSNWNQCF